MRYERWAPIYEEIRADFGFPFEREELAATRLEALLPAPHTGDPLDRLRPRLAGADVVVAGDAPGSGPPPIWRLPSADPRVVVVAADGATAACVDAGLVPEVVVTDLDGPVPAEIAANHRGSVAVVHAHGDNVDAVAEWVPQFPGELVGSWAGPPRDGLLNVGGFTDGDRAAFLADELGARRVLLWGFDFLRVEERSEAARGRKLRKLAWAQRLLGELARSGRSELFLWRRDATVLPYGSAVSLTR